MKEAALLQQAAAFTTIARRIVVAVLFLPLVPLHAAGPRFGPKNVHGPAVSFEGNRLNVTATPGATVYVAGLSLGSLYTAVQFDRVGAVLADSDRDGHVVMEGTVAPKSLWVVVDGSTGGYTIAPGPSTVLRDIDFPGKGVRNGANGVLHRIGVGRRAVVVFVVRPAAGIWAAISIDGTPSDADRTRDGDATVDIEKLQPLAKSGTPPDRLAPGDVVFVIDVDKLSSYDTKVGKP